jgi:hypothetical protein
MVRRYFKPRSALKLMPHIAKLPAAERPDLHEVVLDEGKLVARQEWDSEDVGAGAGQISVYRYAGKFFALDDADFVGPYDQFLDAALAVNLFTVTGATADIWVNLQIAEE